MTGRKPLETVLAVDDDPDVRALLALALEVGGLDARLAANGDEARAAFAERPSQLLLVDVRLGAEDGLTLAAELADTVDPPPCIVLLSATVDATLAARGARVGARTVLAKPFDPLTLGDQLRALFTT